MGQRDPHVDQYIAAAAAFAQPLLTHLREAMHKACPEVEETIKWSMPFFVHQGRILANMAAFKQHCAFGFWHGRDAVDTSKDGEAMGQFGRITSKADLPTARELKAMIKAAALRNEAMAGAPRPTKAPRVAKPAPTMPDDFAAALAAAPAASRGYQGLAPSKQREYVEWVLEAKHEATRQQRITQAVALLAEGKARYWRCETC